MKLLEVVCDTTDNPEKPRRWCTLDRSLTLKDSLVWASLTQSGLVLIMRTWLSGRASPCQGEGRGFESRRPLGMSGMDITVEWPRGEATACKAVYTGSNPVSTSRRRSIGAVG